MKKIGNRTKFLTILISVIIVMAILLFINFQLTGSVIRESKAETSSGVSAPVLVTTENLPQYLSFNRVVQDLPEEALISLQVGSSQYTVKKGSVTEGYTSGADMLVSLPSSYLGEISDFCSVLSSALAKGDLQMTLYISKPAAAWKYKGIYKYRDCLGI